MSRTACWATNDIDVETCLYNVGYGSRWDMIGGEHPFQVGLKGLQTLMRFDYDFYTDIFSNLTNFNITNPMPADKYEEALKIAFDPKKRRLLHKLIDRYVPLEMKYSLSPCRIYFPHLTKKQNDEKALEWFDRCLWQTGRYGAPKFHVERYCENGNIWTSKGLMRYEYIGVPDKYPDTYLMKNIMDRYHAANENIFKPVNLSGVKTYLGYIPVNLKKEALDSMRGTWDDLKDLVEH